MTHRPAPSTIRQYDSNGWHDVKPRCDIDGCTRTAYWLEPSDEFDIDVYLCEEHMRP